MYTANTGTLILDDMCCVSFSRCTPAILAAGVVDVETNISNIKKKLTSHNTRLDRIKKTAGGAEER